jgi:cytoskeleton protein RodZ
MSDLGDLLRRARAYKGVTLRDAERSTRISRRYLAALEAHDFDQLPPLAYSRGIVRNYAQYLGLDPAVVLNLYESAAHQTDEREQIEVVPAVQPIHIQGHWAPNFAIITFMLVISAVIFTWVYSAYLQPSEPDTVAANVTQAAPTGERESLLDLVSASPSVTVTPQATEDPAAGSPETALAETTADSSETDAASGEASAEADPSATPSEGATEEGTAEATEDEDSSDDVEIPGIEDLPDSVTLPADSHVFVVYAEEEVWVEITLDADEYPIFSGTLGEGETTELYIARSATVTSGNAAFVRVYMDGEDMGTLGEPWDAIVTYP